MEYRHTDFSGHLHGLNPKPYTLNQTLNPQTQKPLHGLLDLSLLLIRHGLEPGATESVRVLFSKTSEA